MTAAAAVATRLLSGCTTDEPQTDVALPAEYVYTLHLDIESDSRAEALVEDGAYTYFSFHPGEQASADTHSTFVPGYAVYNASERVWQLHTAAEIDANTFGSASIYYFGPDFKDDSFETLTLDPTKPVYSAQADYTAFAKGAISMQATLYAWGTRFRLCNPSMSLAGVNVQGLTVPASWDRSDSGLMTGQDMTSVPVTTRLDDGMYYSDYYTCLTNDVPSSNFIKLYSTYWSSYSSVMLYEYPDGTFENGGTLTLNITNAAHKTGSFSSFQPSDFTVSYADQTTPGLYGYYTLLSNTNAPTGLHVTFKVKILEYAPEGDYNYGIGLSFDSYTSSNYSDVTTQNISFGSGKKLEIGRTYLLDFSYYNPALTATAYYYYYQPDFLYDGVVAEVSDITITTF